jgi:hypothetical protein
VQPVQVQSRVYDEYFQSDEEDKCGGGMKGTITESINSLSGHTEAHYAYQHHVIVKPAHLFEARLLSLHVDPSVDGADEKDEYGCRYAADVPEDNVLGVLVGSLRDGGVREGLGALLDYHCHVVGVTGEQ